MPRKPMPTEQILSLLNETPQRIAGMTEGLEPVLLRLAPEHDEWSVNDVLAHLRSCAEVWGNCITTILAEDHPTIRAVNPKTWIKQTNYLELEFQDSFHAFTAQRNELLTLLEPLPRGAWSRPATVTGAGNPLARTVQFYAGWLARHERSHIRQIKRIVDAVQQL